MVHVGKYTIHGWYGIGNMMSFMSSSLHILVDPQSFKPQARILNGPGPFCWMKSSSLEFIVYTPEI